MTTVRDIVTRSLRLIEEVGAGQTARAEDANDALVALIAMLDSWSIDGQLVFTETVEDFSLTGNDGSYTIGTGGDFNTTRPLKIRAATIVEPSGTDRTELEVLSMEEYAYQTDLTVTGRPQRVYYDANYPTGTLRFHPVPSQTYTVTLYTEKPLTNFTTVNDTVTMPPGYERALAYNLAVEIAPEFGKQASPAVSRIAIQSRNAIRTQNGLNDKMTMVVDDALVSDQPFDIYSGR